MNYAEVNKATKNYLNLVLEKNRLGAIKEIILEYERNPIVKQYIELKKEIEENKHKMKKKSELLVDSFNDVALTTKDSNNLLVCLGTYFYDIVNAKVCTEQHDNTIKMKYYIDLETLQDYKMSVSKSKEFEIENKIIYLDEGDYGYNNLEHYKSKFIKLRENFFKDLLDNPQEVVMQKLLKK